MLAPGSLSGAVTSAGAPLAGVTVTLSGAATNTTVTDTAGMYSFVNLQNGVYTVTPSMNGYTFTPGSISVNVNGQDVTNQNFTGSAQVGQVIGTLHENSANGPTLGGAAVTCGGQSTTTASDGSYSLSGIPSGSQTLSFSESGYQSFSRTVTITVGKTLNAGNNCLILVPGSPSVNPPGADWTDSPHKLSVSSSGATKIYYRMVYTTDGSTPADPAVPTPSSNSGSIAGPSSTLQLTGTAGKLKKIKLIFAGCNSGVCGPATGVLSYSINLSKASKKTLSIIMNSPNVGTVTGNGIDCGTQCSGTYIQGTSVALTATPKTGWEFSYWDAGSGPDPINPTTIFMDSDKKIIAKFVPQESTFGLMALDSTPLANRIPLILVHGDKNESEYQYYWYNYITIMNEDSAFTDKYKVYLLRWDSTQSNLYNGIAMGVYIDSLPELNDQEIVILAHSRGGLVSRYYMNSYTVDSGQYSGKRGGDRVEYLVTLATPHRGSPGADPIWVYFSFDYSYSLPVSLALSDVYFNTIWDNTTNQFLLWDDVDSKLDKNMVCWDSCLNGKDFCSFLMSNATDILILNQNEKYLKKIIAFAGNNYSASLKADIEKYISDPTGSGLLQLLASDHEKLDLASVLMANMPIIPKGYKYHQKIDNSNWVFWANDGLVPLTSALFLPSGSLNIFKFDTNGNFEYSDGVSKVNGRCQVKECNIVPNKIDHLSFLDDDGIIQQVITKLKVLAGSN